MLLPSEYILMHIHCLPIKLRLTNIDEILIVFRTLLILYGAVEVHIMILSILVYIYLQLVGCVLASYFNKKCWK